MKPSLTEEDVQECKKVINQFVKIQYGPKPDGLFFADIFYSDKVVFSWKVVGFLEFKRIVALDVYFREF